MLPNGQIPKYRIMQLLHIIVDYIDSYIKYNATNNKFTTYGNYYLFQDKKKCKELIKVVSSAYDELGTMVLSKDTLYGYIKYHSGIDVQKFILYYMTEFVQKTKMQIVNLQNKILDYQNEMRIYM